MTSPEYNTLTHLEKIIFTAELIHAVQSDPRGFEEAKQIIQRARLMGYFEGVKILPGGEAKEPEY